MKGEGKSAKFDHYNLPGECSKDCERGKSKAASSENLNDASDESESLDATPITKHVIESSSSVEDETNDISSQASTAEVKSAYNTSTVEYSSVNMNQVLETLIL